MCHTYYEVFTRLLRYLCWKDLFQITPWSNTWLMKKMKSEVKKKMLSKKKKKEKNEEKKYIPWETDVKNKENLVPIGQKSIS